MACPVEDVALQPGTIYMDPDYAGTSGYGWSMPVEDIVARRRGPAWCSEGRVRGEPHEVITLGERKRGALRGTSKTGGAEILLFWPEAA